MVSPWCRRQTLTESRDLILESIFVSLVRYYIIKVSLKQKQPEIQWKELLNITMNLTF